jgi:hypothetical protein
VRFSSPWNPSGTGEGIARMGRTREKNANGTKVSLYIVKRRVHKARKISGGFYKRMKSGM